MIITRTPFRVSFCGGGSDIPQFYKEYGGCVLSTTINKYMYLTLHPYFDEKKTALRYSKIEVVDDIKDIQHSIFNCVLNERNISGVEISSTADVPSGTGLGSSSAFTVGLINLLNCFEEKCIPKERLASEACRIEIERLGNPIGKQDQYASAVGGLNFISFHKDDSVSVEKVITRGDTIRMLQDNLIMFYTGITHNANEILAIQQREIKQSDKINNLMRMCDLAKILKNSIESNDLSDFGKILNESWMKKKELTSSISNTRIDELYDLAIKHGAEGGKLLGAGGGGFLLFYCDKEKQKNLVENLGLKRFDFSFEYDGSSVIYMGDKY